MKYYFYCIIAISVLFVGCKDDPTDTQPDPDPNPDPSPNLECIEGISADLYSCNNIDLWARVSPEDLLGQPLSQQDPSVLNDIWGWTDPQTGTEYALVGLNDGVTFVDISSPSEPVVIGKLTEELNNGKVLTSKSTANISNWPNIQNSEKSSWRDFKVYQDHLYVVSDAQPHGLQIFDLTRLRDVEDPPVDFSEDAHYDGFEEAHNIAINEETGFGYVVGSGTYGGGLHIIDLNNPLDPQFAGFHTDSTVAGSTGYVHDTQCVVYEGPDTDYQGDEICMNSSATHLVIANVTDKQNTTTISKATHDGNAYAHQGWLTEDHQYFLLDDEFDESGGNKTRTYIWDVRDLDDPQLIGTHQSELGSIDHNQYVKGNYVYQSNYTAGLRILSLENIANGELEEVAYFDTFPSNNDPQFDGSWSNYPYFESGVVIVGDISNGLFILQPNL